MSLGCTAQINTGSCLVSSAGPVGSWESAYSCCPPLSCPIPTLDLLVSRWNLLGVSPNLSALDTVCSNTRPWNLPKFWGYLCFSLYCLVSCFLVYAGAASALSGWWRQQRGLRSPQGRESSERMKSWDADIFKLYIQIHFILQNCPLMAVHNSRLFFHC